MFSGPFSSLLEVFKKFLHLLPGHGSPGPLHSKVRNLSVDRLSTNCVVVPFLSRCDLTNCRTSSSVKGKPNSDNKFMILMIMIQH
jgi:hypothetical protein